MKTLDKLISEGVVCDETTGCYSCRFQSSYEGCDIDWSDWVRDALHYLKEYQEMLNRSDMERLKEALRKARGEI